jgi:hypothetical protein
MTPRYYELKAKCPKTGGVTQYRLYEEVVLNVVKHEPGFKYYELAGDGEEGQPPPGSSVAEVLLRPTVIFDGVREYESGGYCYCGTPSQSWSNKGAKLPPRPGRVFVVFVSRGGGDLRVALGAARGDKNGLPSRVRRRSVRRRSMADVRDWKDLHNLRPGFEPKPWYNASGDCLHFVCAEEEYYGERVDGILTVYRSEKSNAIVGCQIKGIRSLLRRIGDFGIEFHADRFYLGSFFYALSHLPVEPPARPGPDRVKTYGELLSRFGGTEVEVPQLVGS